MKYPDYTQMLIEWNQQLTLATQQLELFEREITIAVINLQFSGSETIY